MRVALYSKTSIKLANHRITLILSCSISTKKPLTKVVNSKEVREVQEGATCFCDRKLSKIG